MKHDNRVKRLETQARQQTALTWRELVTGAKQPDPQAWACFLKKHETPQTTTPTKGKDNE